MLVEDNPQFGNPVVILLIASSDLLRYNNTAHS